jgi:hypothetical protein
MSNGTSCAKGKEMIITYHVASGKLKSVTNENGDPPSIDCEATGSFEHGADAHFRSTGSNCFTFCIAGKCYTYCI